MIFFQAPVSRRMSVVNDPFYHANWFRMCRENQTKSKPQLLNLIFSEGQLLENSFGNNCSLVVVVVRKLLWSWDTILL